VKLADGTVGWMYEEYVKKSQYRVSLQVNEVTGGRLKLKTAKVTNFQGKEIFVDFRQGNFTYATNSKGEVYIDSINTSSFGFGGLLLLNERGEVEAAIRGDAYLSPRKDLIVRIRKGSDGDTEWWVEGIDIMDRHGRILKSIKEQFWNVVFLADGHFVLYGEKGARFYNSKGEWLNKENWREIKFLTPIISGNQKIIESDTIIFDNLGNIIAKIPLEDVNKYITASANIQISQVSYKDFSYDGSYFVVTGGGIISYKREGNKYVKLWAKAKGPGHRGYQVRISKDGRYVIEGQWNDRDVYLYDNRDGSIIKKINLNNDSEFFRSHWDKPQKMYYMTYNNMKYKSYSWGGFGPFLFLDRYFIVSKGWQWDSTKGSKYDTDYTEVFIYNFQGELQGYRLIRDFKAIDMVEVKDGIILQGRHGYKKLYIGNM